MTYDVIVTTVHDRADLLERTLRSMLAQLDPLPRRVIVHEDVRAGQPFDPGRTEVALVAAARSGVEFVHLQRNPGQGLGRAVLRLLEEARTDFVLYTQEDFDFLRPIPVGRCLDVMERNDLWHVRWNKRKTEWCKGEDRPEAERFYKCEFTVGDSENRGVIICASDHWYFQASLWRRDVALEGFRHVAASGPVVRCEERFNGWLNARQGCVGAELLDGYARAAKCRTFIWGPVKEPAFIRHTGGERHSQGWR